ncbi:hypothetical protein K488DRAFT_58879 [Vararia minispora EC-137]|uniref:Uncharacterized protein n=1 Tax=Vararia minispora EC-137 TaxID=1314806 RepID=A0ACB8Q9U9_9AGAM|nr:hypothetical protein K488DRAFT_58879 [Vararia minispora EC-137]
MLPRASLVFKGFVGAVLLLNIRSLPFAWHVRVWWPVFVLQMRWAVYRLSFLFKSKEEKRRARRGWVDSLSPVGWNPLLRDHRLKNWADLSDIDYNMHLSNSAYAKALDSARMYAALDFFPGFLIAGGWIALAATHFHFLREIPMLAPYETRMSLVAWDQKWVFLVARFVTHPKKGAKPRREQHGHVTEGAPIPTLHTPVNGVDTPANGGATPLPGASDLKALTAAVSSVEADGALVNCISVNQLVFKHGRVTVPPALVLAYDGFCHHAGDGLRERKYSHANPPPHWEHVCAIRDKGPKAEAAFLRGGWRDVPEAERWWEEAFVGAQETIRTNLAKLMGVREGLEGGRAVVAELFS